MPQTCALDRASTVIDLGTLFEVTISICADHGSRNMT
jgi:hypothetical protein